jgi:hypothetical protein
MSSVEAPQQGPHCDNCCAKPRKIHWFEWLVFLFVIATAVATGFAAKYTYRQWNTADDQAGNFVPIWVS